MGKSRWAGRAAVVVAAAPLVMSAVTAPAAGSTGPPGTPEAERISAGPYEGFQMCQGATLRVVSASPTLAASPTRPAGSTASPFGPFPGLVGRFQVARSTGEIVLRQARPIENGRVFVFQVPQDRLPDGQYRWRMRAENGTAVSNWAPWCPFTLDS
jgi:hypothetical protein